MRAAVRRTAQISLLVAVLYLVVTSLQVWRAATAEAPEPEGAIVVLGAAQYDGRPSPVLRARLDHAVALYRAGLAPVIVVTGSNKPGDRETEAGASASYLHAQGIADEAILREVQGTNTYDQLAATKRILQSAQIDSALLVSDPLHSHRLALTAGETGLDARVSPRTVRISSTSERIKGIARETVAVSLGRVVGFRRLRNLQGDLRQTLTTPLPGVVRGSGLGTAG
jgi:uncharacterized SAM-binding protein YcdF (DUF218 family)